ncbi:hypothetical protein VNI00_003186 [Paramarasmius palmivorus]|uniref:J domain-containing protein n=1 Tax=Paramarasmius palmivorus TaxID=297713 RepID=A0AAW0DS64_9AGAR
MNSRTISVRQAYSALGLQEGVTIDQVKSTYKQLALKTHPDKNPNDPNATAEFQKLGEAYNVLSKHLDTTYDDSDDDDYYDFEDELRDMFFRSLFEHLYSRNYGYRFSHTRFRQEYAPQYAPQYASEYPPRREESNAEFQERLKQSRAEQMQAEDRRKREAQFRRERAEEDRERERQAAEKRQKAKKESKKAQAESERQKAEMNARKQREKTQGTRSAVFQAARKGDIERVKKGVWEEDVDAAGGEVKPGYEEFVKSMPKDKRETLLHIASSRGDCQLVEWLDDHNADVEERDSHDRTPFHTAVYHGQMSVIKYFLERHPPDDSDDTKAIYTSPSTGSTLMLAVESKVPEVVQTVLDKGLCSTQEANEAWIWMTSAEGRATLTKKGSKSSASDQSQAYDRIMALLMQSGGFTPPSTPLTKEIAEIEVTVNCAQLFSPGLRRSVACPPSSWSFMIINQFATSKLNVRDVLAAEALKSETNGQCEPEQVTVYTHNRIAKLRVVAMFAVHI